MPADNVEKLRKFYSQLFGWKIEKTDGMDYWLIETVPVDKQGRPKAQGVMEG
ncbi:MAG: VOC family protein [Nitrososphaerales archaeon]